MSSRQVTYWVAGSGVFTAFLLLIGLDTIGGLAAFGQLCCLVGLPLGLTLHNVLRSRPVVAVVSVAISVALTAIAVQFLIWFRIATPETIVLLATAYGVVLALLLSSSDEERATVARAGGS